MTRHTFLKTFLLCALGAAIAIFAVVPGTHRAAAADHTLTVVGWGCNP
jgi:hypothetical protein